MSAFGSASPAIHSGGPSKGRPKIAGAVMGEVAL
jgi:hypothetical protein